MLGGGMESVNDVSKKKNRDLFFFLVIISYEES